MKKQNNATGITKIYLVDNCYGEPDSIYIGKTVGSRKNNHRCVFGKNINYGYIDEVWSLDPKDWIPIESFWINYFRELGYNVLNKNNGGGGPSFHTEETKERISKSNLGHKVSRKTRKKISKSSIGKTFSEESRRKLGLSKIGNTNMLGKHHSKATRKKISKPRRAGTGEKISKAKKGIIFSEEWKNKISKSKKGYKHSEESKQKMRKPKPEGFGKIVSNRMLGTKFSKETCRKISKNRKGKNTKPILQYDLNGKFIKEWSSQKEAGDFLKVRPSDLSACCRGVKTAVHGYIWKYKIIK